MEYALTKKDASADNLNWQKAGHFENLEPNTEYTLYLRIAETDTHYASDKAYVYFKTLFMPTCTTVTSGNYYIRDIEFIENYFPSSTYMQNEDGTIISDYSVNIKWVSDTEYTEGEGMYVYKAEPDDDYSSTFDFSNVTWPVRVFVVQTTETEP